MNGDSKDKSTPGGYRLHRSRRIPPRGLGLRLPPVFLGGKDRPPHSLLDLKAGYNEEIKYVNGNESAETSSNESVPITKATAARKRRGGPTATVPRPRFAKTKALSAAKREEHKLASREARS